MMERTWKIIIYNLITLLYTWNIVCFHFFKKVLSSQLYHIPFISKFWSQSLFRGVTAPAVSSFRVLDHSLWFNWTFSPGTLTERVTWMTESDTTLKRIWKRIDAYLFITESLCCHSGDSFSQGPRGKSPVKPQRMV